jgi:hypothetical protein
MALVQAWLAVDYNIRLSLLPATDWTIGQWCRLVVTFVVIIKRLSLSLCLRSFNLLLVVPSLDRHVWSLQSLLVADDPRLDLSSSSTLYLRYCSNSPASWTTSLKPVGLGRSCKNPLLLQRFSKGQSWQGNPTRIGRRRQ